VRRIVHLSDLHFGRVREGLAEALLERVGALAPDLVVVSGDLTQRARTWQFQAARAFLDRVDAPLLVVPGNHDVPLENLLERFARPFARYRRFIAEDLEPEVHADGVSVVGVNTVNPFAHQSGRFSSRARRRVCDAFGRTDRAALRIVALHHPLTHGPAVEKRPMRGAEEAVAALAGCGADIVLSGHLHAWDAAPFTQEEGGHETLLIQAGTALSSRLRGEENDFNLLEITPGKVKIERFAASETGAFVGHSVYRFRRDGPAWRRTDGPG
jgi:3',5'-cyclic AMP phosphodiesterase CpdA